jgi:hypothetical protein
MEFIQIKCPKCSNIAKVRTTELVQFCGKYVKIKCPDKSCSTPLKFKVPQLVKQPYTPLSGSKTIVDNFNGDSLKNSECTRLDNNNQSEMLCKGACLMVLKNAKTNSQTFDIKEGVNYIGRLSNRAGSFVPNIAISTKDAFVSKKHCLINYIKRSNGISEFILKDAGSVNGTYLNNFSKPLEKDEEVYLSNEDTLLIGETMIVFKLQAK